MLRLISVTHSLTFFSIIRQTPTSFRPKYRPTVRFLLRTAFSGLYDLTSLYSARRIFLIFRAVD